MILIQQARQLNKPHVRWHPLTDGLSEYPDHHIPGVYSMWEIFRVTGGVCHKIVVHDPKKECSHPFDAHPDRRIMMLLGFD